MGLPNLAETLGFKVPSSYFLRPDVSPEVDLYNHGSPRELTDWDFKFLFDVTGYLLKFNQNPRLALESIAAAAKDREDLWAHVSDGLKFFGDMAIADRAANGLRMTIMEYGMAIQSKFASLLHRANENPDHPDHNNAHFRRHERWLEEFFLRIGVLRHDESIKDWLDSALLVPYFHDMHQLLRIQRNDEDGGNRKVKLAHGLGAQIMLLCFSHEYARERMVSFEEAWRICAGAGIMIEPHEVPENYMRAFSGRELPWTEENGVKKHFEGDELLGKFRSNELDRFKLSPRQIIEIFERSGGELDPDFAQKYSKELAQLRQNYDPLLKNWDESYRRSFMLTAEATVLADVVEMVSPPVEAIFRTLLTQYSMERSFFEMEDINGAVEKIFNGKGNVNEGDSDVRRMFWEVAHLHGIDPDSAVSNSPYVKQVYKENAIMGALAFKTIGKFIMQGDMSSIDSAYEKRMDLLARKALARVVTNPVERAAIAVWAKSSKSFHQAILGVVAGRDGELGQMLNQKFTHLRSEAGNLKNGLANKPGSNEKIRVYTTDEIKRFEQIADAVIARLMEKYNVKPKELKHYKSRLARGKYPASVPFAGYDPLAKFGKQRTLIAPLPAG